MEIENMSIEDIRTYIEEREQAESLDMNSKVEEYNCELAKKLSEYKYAVLHTAPCDIHLYLLKVNFAKVTGRDQRVELDCSEILDFENWSGTSCSYGDIYTVVESESESVWFTMSDPDTKLVEITEEMYNMFRKKLIAYMNESRAEPVIYTQLFNLLEENASIQ